MSKTTHHMYPDTLPQWLDAFVKQGQIRQIDYQFARFIEQQSQDHALAFLSAMVSSELGKGHICLPIDANTFSTKSLSELVGVYGEQAQDLSNLLSTFHWQQVLEASPLVGKSDEPLPLMFDGERLYLHRYWFYEQQLVSKIKCFSTPVSFSPTGVQKLSQRLEILFARDYRYLYLELEKQRLNHGLSGPKVQQLVCDHLDVVTPLTLDWPTIGQKLADAKKVQDLAVLDQLVPDRVCLNWQKVAAAVALSRRFAVISGGPGTGKTTTVTKLLAALTEQAMDEGSVPEIKLIAPTGKAAARLTESIGKAIDQLSCSPDVKKVIPTEASTIHRLLGALPHSAEFRHNSSNPLHLDILVVDEASMVDLAMMAKLLEALPEKARLILLGDKDQLASVEAGAVLGDICSFHSQGFSDTQGKLLAAITGFETLATNVQGVNSIADGLCMLQKSYRFDARSGIGQLAKVINNGDAKGAEAIWKKGFEDIERWPVNGQNYSQMLQQMVEGYRPYLEAAKTRPKSGQWDAEQQAKKVLFEFQRCRLLCAVREGEFGVSGLNERIERVLAARKLIAPGERQWYHGRPVMVSKNDHGNGLYNGDIGICLYESAKPDARLKVYFELPDGSIKSVLPSRVPPHETAYAMTIHKSQGSEFEHTLLIFPPEYSPIITRELIYTGVTRAKKRLSLYVDNRVLVKGVSLVTERASGLVHRLSQPMSLE